MQYVIRGNILHSVDIMHLDPVWTPVDRTRFATLRARFPSTVSDDLIQCMVWKMKLPGLCYNPTIESTIHTLWKK